MAVLTKFGIKTIVFCEVLATCDRCGALTDLVGTNAPPFTKPTFFPFLHVHPTKLMVEKWGMGKRRIFGFLSDNWVIQNWTHDKLPGPEPTSWHKFHGYYVEIDIITDCYWQSNAIFHSTLFGFGSCLGWPFCFPSHFHSMAHFALRSWASPSTMHTRCMWKDCVGYFFLILLFVGLVVHCLCLFGQFLIRWCFFKRMVFPSLQALVFHQGRRCQSPWNR